MTKTIERQKGGKADQMTWPARFKNQILIQTEDNWVKSRQLWMTGNFNLV